MPILPSTGVEVWHTAMAKFDTGTISHLLNSWDTTQVRCAAAHRQFSALNRALHQLLKRPPQCLQQLQQGIQLAPFSM